MNDDEWLDAFDLDDFGTADLRALDRAVDRLAPRRSPRRWLGPLVGGVAALAAVLLAWIVGSWAAPATVAETPPDPVPAAAPVVVVEQAAPAPTPPPTPDPRVVPVPEPVPRQPGLLAAPGTLFRTTSDRATLAHGRLTYRHDDDHDPGVSEVALEGLPVVFAPVGTVFHVETRKGVALLAVEEGTVRVLDHTGAALATLVGPAEAAFFDAPTGPVVVSATDASLDELLTQVPASCGCQRADVVSTITRLRLALRQSTGVP